MKTQILNNSIKAFTLIMFLALTAVSANAQQRRTTENNRRNEGSRSVTQEYKHKSKPYHAPQESGTYKTYKHKNSHKHHYKHHKNWAHQNYYASQYRKVHVYTNTSNHYGWEHRPDICFKKLPKKAYWVYLNNEHYFVHRGKFYQSSPWGYYRVKTPLYIHYLPEGHDVHWVNGKRFYNYNDLVFIYTPRGFRIINS